MWNFASEQIGTSYSAPIKVDQMEGSGLAALLVLAERY